MHRFPATLATLALALTPTIALMSAPPVLAAPRPLQRLRVTLTSDVATVRPGDTITYTLRATNTGRAAIAQTYLAPDPPPDLALLSQECHYTAPGGGDAYFNPDGWWCEYGILAPGDSVTVTFAVQYTQVSGYAPPVVAMVGCATIVPQVGGIPPTFTCAASALA